MIVIGREPDGSWTATCVGLSSELRGVGADFAEAAADLLELLDEFEVDAAEVGRFDFES